MPMMFGYGGYGIGGGFMMLISAGVFGLITYWAVYSGVKNAMRDSYNKDSEK